MAKELRKNTKGTKKSSVKAAKRGDSGKTAKAVAVRKAKVMGATRKAVRKEERKVLREEKQGKSRKALQKEGQAVSQKEQKTGKRRWLIALVALILLIAAGITTAVCLWEHEVPEEISQEEPVSEPEEPEPEPEPEGPADGDEPLVPETEVVDWSAYTVAPNKPRYLTIAAIGLYNVPIVEVGLTSGGAMGAPDSNFVAGWYYRSAYPGKVGNWATVIDGHGGPLWDGVFRYLPNLPVGGEIVIEMGDGRKFTYVVSERVFKDKGAEANAYMKVADRPVDVETPTLTLITCVGEWISAEQTYSQRLFVRAVLKK